MRLADTINETKLEDERAMVKLTNENALSGFKKLNITYNFGMRKIGHNYKIADKPLRVVHFHPQSRGREVLDSFMYGKNKLGFPLMNSRLIMLFKKYGFE